MRIPHPSAKKVQEFLKILAEIPDLQFSIKKVDLVSASGDSTGNAFNHWRWKRQILPDCVIWPTSKAQVQTIVQLATKYRIPITPRGGGTCYYGSSVPAAGGILLDLKRMKQFKIIPNKKTLECEGGVVFGSVLHALEKKGFELHSYPSSARSATIAGWISSGAKAGIGTVQKRTFIDTIQQLTLIDGHGVERVLDTPEIINHFAGSTGILGILVKITVEIYPICVKFPFLHKTDDIGEIFSSLEKIVENEDITYLRFGNCIPHSYNKKYHIFSVYSLNSSKTTDLLNRQPTSDGIQEWAGRFDFETKFKRSNVLFVQQIWIDFSNMRHVVAYLTMLCRKYHHNFYWYGMMGTNLKVRLVILIPTTTANWRHFMVSKALGHYTVKHAYCFFGTIYSYGLQNTPYLRHFEPERVKFWQSWKKRWDPIGIMNPFKIVSSRVNISRLSFMFRLNLLWHRLYSIFHKNP